VQESINFAPLVFLIRFVEGAQRWALFLFLKKKNKIFLLKCISYNIYIYLCFIKQLKIKIMKAKIEFNTKFGGIAEREIPFTDTIDAESQFKEIISKMPNFIKRSWASIETENWSLQSHHIIECEGNFWLAMEIKL
jgi:hypothetical protein